jgi:hypothetical protein
MARICPDQLSNLNARLGGWRPRRNLNPCYRRERTTTIRKYNDLQEAGGHLSPCQSVEANTLTYRNPYREKKPRCCTQSQKFLNTVVGEVQPISPVGVTPGQTSDPFRGNLNMINERRFVPVQPASASHRFKEVCDFLACVFGIVNSDF